MEIFSEIFGDLNPAGIVISPPWLFCSATFKRADSEKFVPCCGGNVPRRRELTLKRSTEFRTETEKLSHILASFKSDVGIRDLQIAFIY